MQYPVIWPLITRQLINTAEQLADGWYAWAQTQQTVSDSQAAVNVTNLQNGRETNLSHTHQPWQIYSEYRND